MLNNFRHGAPLILVSGFACLAGCSAPNASPAATALYQPGPPFTLNTPVSAIVADPQGKAILDRDVPGLTTDKNYVLFEDMSLTQIAALSSGKISKTTLDQTQADLAQLPPAGKTTP